MARRACTWEERNSRGRHRVQATAAFTTHHGGASPALSAGTAKDTSTAANNVNSRPHRMHTPAVAMDCTIDTGASGKQRKTAEETRSAFCAFAFREWRRFALSRAPVALELAPRRPAPSASRATHANHV